MMTACVDGRPFSCCHTFRVSDGENAQLGLDWFQMYKQFCVRLGLLEPCVDGIQMEESVESVFLDSCVNFLC